jgi:hypothetical protein
MSKTILITTFRNLEVSGLTGDSFELTPGISLTNDSAAKSRLLAARLKPTIGQLEFGHLLKADSLVYGTYADQERPELPNEKFLLALIIIISSLFRTAWLIKDHCLECDAAFLVQDIPGGFTCSSNFLAQRTLLASGDAAAPTRFSLQELREWRNLHDKISTYFHQADSSERRFFMERDYCRSARALQFVNSARTSTNLALRVTHYCSALEALFLTDSAELSHKLSERAAFFLGEFGYNRNDVFKNIKAAYSIRSKLTHGDALSKRAIDELPNISVLLDSYLRAIFRALFGAEWLVQTFDGPPDRIEAIFNEGILNGKSFRGASI